MLKKIAAASVLVFIAIFSAFILWGTIIKPSSYDRYTQTIDNNIATVLKLTGSSTAASAAVSMIPGDTATPVAEKLADFSTYFVISLCVLYLEKFLMVLTGYFSFVILIPLACGLGIISLFNRPDFFRLLAAKICLGAFLIATVIPASVGLSDAVYQLYKPTIDQTIDNATEVSGSIQDSVEDENDKSGFLSGLAEGVAETFSLALDGAEKLISNYVESLAVMIVVACLIPLLVLAIYIWLLKTIFSVPTDQFWEMARSNYDGRAGALPGRQAEALPDHTANTLEEASAETLSDKREK